METATFLPEVRAEFDAAYQAARNQPGDADATGRVCKLLDAHDQAEAAAQCYRRASFLRPKDFEWHYHLGAVRMGQSRYADAIASFRAALALTPYRPAVLKLAQCLREAGIEKESLPLLQQFVSEEPGNAQAWYELGRVPERLHDASGAEQSYRKACDLFPNYGASHYSLALLLQRRGQAESARQHFRMAEQHKTEVPPSNDAVRGAIQELAGGTTPLLRRAAAFEKAGQLDAAIRENLAALTKDPALLQAHINLIALYGRGRQVREAERHYRSAMELPGGKADADYNYGVLLTSEELAREGEQAFRRALAANPQHAQAHHNLGVLLEGQGRTREALVEYEAAVASQTEYRLAHFHAGRLLAAERRYPAAIAHLLQTVEPVDESTPGYLYALSATYARAGQFQPALQFGERARSEAAVRGQADLLDSIDRDLQRIRTRAHR